MPKSMWRAMLCSLLATGGMTATGRAAASTQAPAGTESTRVAPSDSGAASAGADDLIYCVNRTPERTFDTARAAQVITRDEILRRGARTLSDALLELTGLTIIQNNYAAGLPLIRGMFGKQIQILVDGVKINNSVWRATGLQYLNLIDIDMVERIEIVRGVVSVLGTESLAGAINVVTRKGPVGRERFGVMLSPRASTADEAWSTPLQVYGQGERYRFLAGGNYRQAGDERGGKEVPSQPTAYHERNGDLSFEYYLSTQKTLAFAFQDLREGVVPRTDSLADLSALVNHYDHGFLQLGRLSYEDLTNHRAFQYLKLTGYWNNQGLNETTVTSSRPTRRDLTVDSQMQYGANLEFRSYFGAHRLIYGVDATTEAIDSTGLQTDLRSSVVTPVRGRYTDRAGYQTLGAYLLDHFNVGHKLTASVGYRYGVFRARGTENSSIGVLDLDSSKSDDTYAASLSFHATPSFNLVGSVMRGFRAPNLDDISVFNPRREGTEVPNPNLSGEHVLDLELGAKYERPRASGSVFVYRSSLDDLLIRAAGTYQGLSFIDANGNGVQDANEAIVLQRHNLGRALIKGVEVEGRLAPTRQLTLSANFFATRGDDETADEPLSRIPAGVGTVRARFLEDAGRRPWIEAVYHFGLAQRRLSQRDREDSRIGPAGTPAFNVFHLRGGLKVTEHADLMVSWDNITDEKYKYHGSGVYRPGSQFAVAAQFRF